MAFVKNFDQTVVVGPDSVHVSGNSDPIDDAHLLSRNVALLQGESYVGGPTEPDSFKWAADIPLGDVTFDTGPQQRCTAIGTETYVIDPDQNPGAIATTVTVTWVQTVAVEKA